MLEYYIVKILIATSSSKLTEIVGTKTFVSFCHISGHEHISEEFSNVFSQLSRIVLNFELSSCVMFMEQEISIVT